MSTRVRRAAVIVLALGLVLFAFQVGRITNAHQGPARLTPGYCYWIEAQEVLAARCDLAQNR